MFLVMLVSSLLFSTNLDLANHSSMLTKLMTGSKEDMETDNLSVDC